MPINPPKHDDRVKGPKGEKKRPLGAIIHCTVSNPIPNSPRDRHGVIDFLASKGISVPVVNDDEGSTIMTPLGYLGYGHAGCLTGKAWGIEQVGQASWSRETWLKHEGTIHGTAKWSAWVLSELMDLPVTERTLSKFIVGHVDDQMLGGCSDHWDPGPGYPWKVMYEFAMDEAKVVGYRLRIDKGDEVKIKDFEKERVDVAKRILAKKLKHGVDALLKRRKYPSDFEAWS